MRTSALLFALGMIIICTPTGFAQNCSDLEQENQRLREELTKLQIQYGKVSDPEVEITTIDPDTEVKILEVVGNKTLKTVNVRFQIFQNSKPHQKARIKVNDFDSKSKAYDDNGKEYEPIYGKLGSAQGRIYVVNQLPRSVPLNGEMKFSEIDPNTARLKLLMMDFATSNFNDGNDLVAGVIEVKNLKINWH
jgi:hypothetical protein